MREMPQGSEYSNPRLERIIRALAETGDKVSLYQDTEDTEQLKPIDRLRSIEKVWLACRQKLGNPKTAIDAGSGFGYGTVFLETLGTKTIGVEKVVHKVDQAVNLFNKIGIPIRRTSEVDFADTPAFINADFNTLPADSVKAEIVTMFYLSGEMALNPSTIEKSRNLLQPYGKLVLSTEVPSETVKALLEKNPIPAAHWTIVDVKDNFEKTVIIVEFE